MRSEPDFASKWYEFGRLLLEHVLKVGVFRWRHASSHVWCIQPSSVMHVLNMMPLQGISWVKTSLLTHSIAANYCWIFQ